MTPFRIEEDKNKVITSLVHRKMLDEIYEKESINSGVKKEIQISFSVQDENNKILGGVAGWIRFDYLVLEILWVDKAIRGSGAGRKLIKQLEEAARAHQCIRLLTSTNSDVDSLGFWLKNDFELLGTSEGIIKVYYLQKNLT